MSRPAAPGALVEVATWPPVEVVDVAGWRAGVSGGFTRRANSALPVGRPDDVEGAIEEVEGVYRRRGLPPRFRVCSAATPPDLDERLAARGYHVVATTDVLVRQVAAERGERAGAGDAAATIRVANAPDTAWLSGWLDVKAPGTVDHGLAHAVVSGAPATYLTAVDDLGVAGVIRAAAAGAWLGLSCLMVAERARRRGLATALTTAALLHAATQGASWAFLQVESGNAAARAVYEGMGFQPADRYHYRER